MSAFAAPSVTWNVSGVLAFAGVASTRLIATTAKPTMSETLLARTLEPLDAIEPSSSHQRPWFSERASPRLPSPSPILVCPHCHWFGAPHEPSRRDPGRSHALIVHPARKSLPRFPILFPTCAKGVAP